MAKSATTKKSKSAPTSVLPSKSKAKPSPDTKSTPSKPAKSSAETAKIGVQPLTQKSLVLVMHNLNQTVSDLFESGTGGFPTTTQFALFNAIQSFDMPNQTQLGHATGMDRSTVAEVLKRLHARRAINRQRLPSDERAFVITMTPLGLEALDRGKKALAIVEEKLSSVSGFQQALSWATTLASEYEEKVKNNGKASSGPSPKIARIGPTSSNLTASERIASSTVDRTPGHERRERNARADGT